MSWLVAAPRTFTLTAPMPKSPCDLLPFQISTFLFSLRWRAPLPNSSLLPTVIFEPSMVFLAGLCPHQHQATPVLPPAWPPPLFHIISHAETTSRLQSPHPVPPNPSCEPTPPHSLTPTCTSHLSPSPASQLSIPKPWPGNLLGPPHLPPRSDRETTLPSSPGTQDLAGGAHPSCC